MPPTEATLTRLHADYAVSAYRFAWSGFREIGELLGLPTQTVASRYRYGLEKLRAQKHTLV